MKTYKKYETQLYKPVWGNVTEYLKNTSGLIKKELKCKQH